MPFLKDKTATIVAGTGNTVVYESDVQDLERIFFEIAVATQALDAFLIQAKSHPDGSYQTLYSAAADFTSPQGVLVGASGDLTTQAAGSSGWFLMDVRGVASIKLLASAAADSATVNVYAGGQ